MLANDLRAYTDRTIGKAGEELRCNVDFIEGKVKKYLVALRDSLAEAKNKLLLTTDLKTAQEIVAGLAVKVDADVTPGVCGFSPAVINVTWADHRSPRVSGVQGNHVYLSGYGLKLSDPKALTLWVESADKKRREVTQHLTVHTAYSASIDLSDTGLRFTPDNAQDRRILLLYRDAEIGAVKLQWADAPPVPPKLANIKSVLTTTTHKEAGGQVELTFFHADRKLADSLHAQKRRHSSHQQGHRLHGAHRCLPDVGEGRRPKILHRLADSGSPRSTSPVTRSRSRSRSGRSPTRRTSTGGARSRSR